MLGCRLRSSGNGFARLRRRIVVVVVVDRSRSIVVIDGIDVRAAAVVAGSRRSEGTDFATSEYRFESIDHLDPVVAWAERGCLDSLHSGRLRNLLASARRSCVQETNR